MQSADKYNFDISFSPTDEDVAEIEKWLIAEEKKAIDGFYCNWKIIMSAHNQNTMATISHRNKAIGFAIWFKSSDLSAHLDIAERTVIQE